jgi:hypothetical protein
MDLRLYFVFILLIIINILDYYRHISLYLLEYVVKLYI